MIRLISDTIRCVSCVLWIHALTDSCAWTVTEAASTAACEQSFSLFVCEASNSSSTLLALSGDLTLGHINDKYWKSNRPLELFYVLDGSPGLGW